MGGVCKIRACDVSRLNIRALTPAEIMRANLRSVTVADLDNWAEMILDEHRFYYVAVLTRDSTFPYSTLNTFDALLAGMHFRPPSTPGPLTVRLREGREARVTVEPLFFANSIPQATFMRYPFMIVNPTPFLAWPDIKVGPGHISFMPDQITQEFSHRTPATDCIGPALQFWTCSATRWHTHSRTLESQAAHPTLGFRE